MSTGCAVTHVKTTLATLCIFLLPLFGLAQSTGHLIINNIVLEGLDRTKEDILLRELNITQGDTILLPALTETLEENKKRILSTALFNLVSINVKNWEGENADIHISVREAWYIYLTPIFELADRNFNVWWNEQGRSFDRVNYGLRLDHINLTGRRDYLKLKFQRGYTRKYEAKYIRPFVNEAKTIGLRAEIFYSDNRELSYITQENKPVFYQSADEKKLLERFRTGIGVDHRPSLYFSQGVRLEYHNNGVNREVADLNPNYFLDDDIRLKFFLLQYFIDYDRRNFFIYPDAGYKISLDIKKEGFDLAGKYNNLPITLGVEAYHSLNEKNILSARLKARTSPIRETLAFANNTGLGYGEDYVSGYELYVMDGRDFFYGKFAYSLKIFEKVISVPYMPVKQFKLNAIKAYLRWQTDIAYVNEPTYISTNFLNNRWLIGYGPALDIILYNNYLIKFEYTSNHLNERGLYIHTDISF